VSFLLVLALLLGLPTRGQAYTREISVTLREATLLDALRQINRQGNNCVSFKKEVVEKERGRITLALSGVSVREAVERCLAGSSLGLVAEGDNLLVVPAGQPQRETVLVTGRVTGTDNAPLVGVTVQLKGTQQGTATDREGRFVFVVVGQARPVMVFSFIGMETREMTFTGEPLMVVMKDVETELEEVVVTGIFTRRAESFTGAAQTFTQQELRRVGNGNVLQSIKNLDPSFHIVENLENGSDPNRAPQIELRGQSGFPDLRGEYRTDPNQPLFVLDGFEVTLTKVIDLDMSRVESVTLLKDAAAKAIYGFKAANGVVVIETHRPEPGKLRATYTANMNVTAPDLSSYNLTNAAEKLEVERNARRYVPSGTQYEYADRQYALDENYNRILEEVLRGVNTDWLSQPLRLGVGQKHVLYLEGGDQFLRYGVDVSYNNVKGVMIGSDRNTITGSMTLSYRYEKFLFRDQLEVSYNKGINSPYGNFASYARMNPYFRVRDEKGQITRVAGENAALGADPFGNPMWNSTINTKDFTEYAQITNNFYAEWLSSAGLKVTARASVSRNDAGHEIFHPASHTDFITYTSEELAPRRGQYIYGDGTDLILSADVNATYSANVNKHLFFTNVGWNINHASNRYLNFVTEGFPNDWLDDITFARQYLLDSRPVGAENTTRDLGVLGVLNYAYDDRYLLDASLRANASSQFGRDRRWGNFWSLGLGWNLHNEGFVRDLGIFDQFRLRGSIGFTGSQAFNSYQSKSTFSYSSSDTYLGHHGAFLMGIENDRLKWQRKYDQSIGLDLTLFKRRLAIRADLYSSYTDDLLTDVTLPSSTGFRDYKENLGETRNAGQEFRVTYRAWDGGKNGFLSLYAAGAHNANRVQKISNFLATMNEEQLGNATNRPFVRYVEGQSMSAIWAVPSYGIDPASGREIFVRQDGTITHTWSADDVAPCGDTQPTLRGNSGLNFDYKGFSLNMGMTWLFGGQIYNQTLVDKVENADTRYNVDRRVFSDRWRVPGDISRFKDITNTSTTRSTQRFIEDQNEWTLSSINLSYDLDRLERVRRAGFSRLRLSFDMSDVARLSSVRIERGTSYPFARSFSLSLQAMF
jgi:TonB-linked SusC/RagA family outer membrane protein